MKIYGDRQSGNCLKVNWVCEHLALPYDWIEVDTLKSETRTPEFLKLDSAGQVPTFWEQYSHEPYAAVCRFEMRYLGKQASDLDPEKLNRGYAALRRMEWHFAETPFLVANRFSLADISLLAYTRLAHQGGFDLAPFAALRRWIAACEGILGLPPATLCSGTSSHYPMRAST